MIVSDDQGYSDLGFFGGRVIHTPNLDRLAAGEDHDLSAECPELLASLKARFDDWKKTMDAAEPRGPFRDY